MKHVTNSKPRSRWTRSLPAGLLSSLAVVLPAGAQTAPVSSPAAPAASPESVITMEAFSVTGSNIKRTDQEKVLPVTVMNFEQIQARDSATPMDLLTAIPQITNIPANETSTNAVAARGDNANVALRGLGASNTLVVLNGRRTPFHPFNTSSVNVNTLPTFGLQQVEVLRDGASAIYGSDAVAGVVNYVTKKEPSGSEVSVRFGVTEHGGGMDGQLNIGYGTTFAGGKGSWLLNYTAYNRDAIYLSERESSRYNNKSAEARAPWNVNGSTYDTSTATGNWVSFRLGTGTSGALRYFYPTDGTETGTPTINTAALPRSLYENYNDYTMGQPMSARMSLYNRLEYDVTDSIRAFAEISGYISKSTTGRQPITLNASDAVVTLSVDNPFNPLGARFYSPTGAANADGTARLTGTPQTITINAMFLEDGGPEKIEATGNMYRFLAGLEGKFGQSTWTWETAVMYGAVRATDNPVNSIRESKLKAAALRSDAYAWNPFGYTFQVANGAVVVKDKYSNPQYVRETYTSQAWRYGHSNIFSADVRTGGQIVNTWAGPIAASTGLEWRREFKEDTKDPFVNVNPVGSGLDEANNDILVMSPKFDYDAYRTIASAFAETVVPLASPSNDIPGLYSLELNASVRYEDYLDFGETTKPKYGINWKPLSSIMVRASMNEGFSAPDLATLYQPASFSVGSPPGTRDTVRVNYLQSAIPGYSDTQVLTKGYSLGNPDLQPEESEGKSVGIAIDVPFVKGLSFTIDYWEIEQNNLIISQGRDTSIDAQLLLAYTQSELAKGVPISQINFGSRLTPNDPATNYKGDVNTLRAAVTAEDIALYERTYAVLPQSAWMAPMGQWIGTISQSINGTGGNFTSGVDYSVSYSLPNTPIGQFRLSTEWSQFLDKYTQNTPTSPINDDIVSMTTAEWKSTTTLQWRKEAWNASLSATWSSDVRTGATTTAAVWESLGRPDYIKQITNNGSTSYVEEGEAQIQLNAGLGYRFGGDANAWVRNTTVRLGINNLLDEEPSPTSGASGYSGSTGSSLWVGRAYSFTFTRTF